MSCAPHVPFAGRRSARLGAIAAAALGLTASMLGGVAHADIPGAGGVYTGCYSRSSGVLRVIDFEAGQRCRSGELTVRWNQTGPTGPTGPQGLQGIQGPKGDTGPAGTLNITEHQGDSVLVPAQGAEFATATCPAGQNAVSSGYIGDVGVYPVLTERFPDSSTWTIQFVNTTNSAKRVSTIVYCSP